MHLRGYSTVNLYLVGVFVRHKFSINVRVSSAVPQPNISGTLAEVTVLSRKRLSKGIY